MTETNENGAIDQHDAPPTKANNDWIVQRTKSFVRGREALIYLLRPHAEPMSSADLFPELAAAQTALRESDEMKKLETVKQRYAEADEKLKSLLGELLEANEALQDGSADPAADVAKLHKAQLKILREVQQAEYLVQIIAEEWKGRRLDVQAKAKEIESGLRSISLVAFEEAEKLRQEISEALTPILNRFARVSEIVGRAPSGIPERDSIVGPDPPSPVRYEKEQPPSPFFGVPSSVPTNR